MDSVCDEAGPRELTKLHLKCTALSDIQKEAADFLSIAEVQKEAADATPTGSQASQKEPTSVPAGRTPASAPKPGKSRTLSNRINRNPT